MTGALHERLTSYLSDAHSIEEQALAQLRSVPSMPGAERFSSLLSAHLEETERHERIVRGLLESRDAQPSWFKDTVMKIGGKGFILFARANPDTPGKLLSHALSYEALEEASYLLLAQVAEQAGEGAVVAAAQRIAAEEANMKDRLEGCFDEGAEASLAALAPDDLESQLVAYLADAHALEEQSAKLLERAAREGSGGLEALYEAHLEETRSHAAALSRRLDALGHDTSSLKDAAMRMGAMNWAAFFEAQPDTPGKLAAFAYAFEHLEIGGYEQLHRVAERAGDQESALLAVRNLSDERKAAAGLKSLFPEAARLALAARP
jgi:ferritin-like metal-binding protein YciE